MTYEKMLKKFEDMFPLAEKDDYRPVCHELFTEGKEGITIWLKNGDIIVYYPKAENGDIIVYYQKAESEDKR